MPKNISPCCTVVDEKAIMTRVMELSDPWYVKEIIFDERLKAVIVKIDFKKGATFNYEAEDLAETGDYKVYDTRSKTVRHFTYGQYPLYLKVRVPRVKTPNNKIRLLTPYWFGHVSGFTLQYEAHILKMACSTPVRSISSIANLTGDKTWRVIDTYIAMARELEDYSAVTAIGIDETSIRKHHKYITLFVDLKKSEP